MSYARRETLGKPLTEREKEIALLVSEGLLNKEIADRLFVTPETVKSHLTNIYFKVGIHQEDNLNPRVMLTRHVLFGQASMNPFSVY